jgi:hypothetical protein
MGQWALTAVGLAPNAEYVHHMSLGKWAFEGIYGKISIWTPVPEIARHAIVWFLDIWVEGATITSGIFLIPRILQKDWEYLCKHIITMGEIYPWMLPVSCVYDSHIPFVLLYVPFYVRSLPNYRVVESAPTPVHTRWHMEQADHLRGL